jgi:glucose-6-phosphate isomerase
MSHWHRFQKHFLRYDDLGISLDISRMGFDDAFFKRMAPLCDRALAGMAKLEAGAIANPDENRMVGHYWLRMPELAPTPALKAAIEKDIADSIEFAKAVHAGTVAPPGGGRFKHLLIAGIGGSALGPQLATDALVDAWRAPLQTHFFDNTDPEGMQRVLDRLGDQLGATLTVVISKSGGTPETRNGMLAAAAIYQGAGLDFAKHAVAVTGTAANGIKSKLEATATENGWLKIFPMTDWVGGRTSLMSTVGLVPMALQGVDIRPLLAGAAAVDAKTRSLPAEQNISLLLALMWHHASGGRGAKDMVILPYKDRLALFSKYLQQLVMESLGKELDLDGNKVNQGLAVYGNKGSTDQHAYVQQLRDGVNNFFATFIEVREAGATALEVDPGVTPADYLQGFLRGTRSALFANGRESVTLSVPRVDAFYLGALIAVYERAVGFYASLINVNAYHQPGVEAGKKAAAVFLELLGKVRGALNPTARTADQIAGSLGADPEDVWHCLNHLAANEARVSRTAGASPGSDTFRLTSG